MRKLEKIIVLLLIFSLIFAFPAFTQEETEIQPEELEIKTPQILPTSGAYSIKDFFRKLRLLFAFSAIKKAELRLKFANEKLLEVKEIAKSAPPELIEKSLTSYQEELEKAKLESEKLKKEDQQKFLKKYTTHALKQQMVLENIASQVKGDVYEKILANRERHLERFKEVMEKVENKKELKEKIKETVDEVIKVSPSRVIKIYETIKEIEEKVPEEIKPEIEKIRKEMIVKVIEKVKTLPVEDQEKEIKTQIRIFANPFIAQEVIEEIKNKEPEIVLPPISDLSTEILQEKIGPLNEEKKTEILEKMTKERIKHLERLEEVKEKLEKLPEPAVSPQVIERVIKNQIEKIEAKIEKLRNLPIGGSRLEEIKEELKEAPKIKQEIIKQAPNLLEIKELELKPAPEEKSTQLREKEIGFCGWSTKFPCQTDEDCLKSGCSGQVCQGKNEPAIITTCEWRDCYDADIYKVKCGCFKGKCQWYQQ